jgi:hypothetical protein
MVGRIGKMLRFETKGIVLSINGAGFALYGAEEIAGIELYCRFSCENF